MTQLTDAIDAGIAEIPITDRVAPTSLGYGTDLSCVTDVTPSVDEVDPRSPTAIGEAVLRRLITPRRGVVDDEGYGFDLRGYCNRGVTETDVRSIAARTRAECKKDDRVSDADVTMTYADRRLSVSIIITPEDVRRDDFTLTFWVSADGIELQESIDQHG
jgi:hypothetical protein